MSDTLVTVTVAPLAKAPNFLVLVPAPALIFNPSLDITWYLVPLDLVAVENSPNVKIVTNVPIKTKVYNFDSKYIHALFKDYVSTQSSTIDLYSEEDEPITKVLNDSEKQMSITSSKEYEGNIIDYLRYTLTPL